MDLLEIGGGGSVDDSMLVGSRIGWFLNLPVQTCDRQLEKNEGNVGLCLWAN